MTTANRVGRTIVIEGTPTDVGTPESHVDLPGTKEEHFNSTSRPKRPPQNKRLTFCVIRILI